METDLRTGSNLTNNIPKEMHAVLFYGPKDIRYEKVPVPEINDGEILVQVKTVLTGGTDLKTYERGHPVLIKSTPSPFGHQFSGIVVKTGKNVKDLRTGKKVFVANSAPCFECRFCKKERYSLCEDLLFLNGAYAEYIKIPDRIVKYNTYEVSDDIDFEAIATAESIAVCLNGIEKSGVDKGKTVCIIGTGQIGLTFVFLCKLFGAKVISVGRKEQKLQVAKRLGADFVFKLEDKEKLKKGIKSVTEEQGPAVVIEAVGLPEVWELGTEIVAKGGLVNFFGGCKKGTSVQLDTYKLHYEELKLIGVFHHTPFYIKKALELVKSKKSEVKNLIQNIITHKMHLKELEKAFILHKEGKAIQVAINVV